MDVSVLIDPKGPTPEPNFAFERRRVPQHEVHYDVVTKNGYRVTLVSSVSEDLNTVGFVGILYQALIDFQEFDPRSTHGEKYASTPRKTSIENNFLGKSKEPVPMNMYLAITKVAAGTPPTEITPIDGKTHLGRFEYHMARLVPEYFSEKGRGRIMETNYMGIPAPGHKEFFHAFEVPFLPVGAEPLGNGYTKDMMRQDMVHGVANGLEMMTDEVRWPDPDLRKEYKGMSVSKTSKVATIGDTPVNSMDFIVNSVCKKEISVNAATLPHLTDRLGQSLWIDNNTGRAAPVAIPGFFRSEATSRYERDIRANEVINLRASFGAYSHEFTGSGKEMHLFQIPQYLGEPMWNKLGPVNASTPRLTHSEQLRNYLLAVASSRIMSPRGSVMKSSHPRFDSGIYYKSAEFDTIKRTAYCRYIVMDTLETKREVESKAVLINWSQYGQNPMSTWWTSKHDYRGQAGQYSVQYPGSGHVLLDVNLGLGHNLNEVDYRPSSELNWYVVERMAKIVGYHLNNGVSFVDADSRVVMSASESGGHRFYPEMGEHLSRLWFEIDGHSKALQRGEKAVDEYQHLSVGNYSVEAIDAMVGRQRSDEVERLEREKLSPRDAFFQLERRQAAIAGKSISEATIEKRWKEADQAFTLDYTAKWSSERTTIYRVSEYCKALQKEVAIWQVYDVIGNRNAAASSIIMRQAECVNRPHFYGPIDEKSGNPLFALSWLHYSMEEDFRRPGVWLKREMRMQDGNIRNIMYLLGYRMKRKESGHEWDEESTRLAIDSEGRFKRGGKMVVTDRQEITFHFKNFFIWEFDPKLWSELYPDGTQFSDVAPHILSILKRLQEEDERLNIDYEPYRAAWGDLRARKDAGEFTDSKVAWAWIQNTLGYELGTDTPVTKVFDDIQSKTSELDKLKKGTDTSWQKTLAQLEMAQELMMDLMVKAGGELDLRAFSHPGMPGVASPSDNTDAYDAAVIEYAQKMSRRELDLDWALAELGYDPRDSLSYEQVQSEKEKVVKEAQGTIRAKLERALQIAVSELPSMADITMPSHSDNPSSESSDSYDAALIELNRRYRSKDKEFTIDWALDKLGYSAGNRLGLTMERVGNDIGSLIQQAPLNRRRAELEVALRVAFDYLPAASDLYN